MRLVSRYSLRVGVLRWSKEGGQKQDVYYFCHDRKNQQVVARPTA